ncbi:MAG: replication restart helicase PriA [Alphaproteobacteria bacterium]
MLKKTIAQVLIPRPFDQPFSYIFEECPSIGDWVEVPFGNSAELGVVWSLEADVDISERRLKSVTRRFPAKAMALEQVALVERIASDTMMTLGEALRLSMPPRNAINPKSTETRVFRSHAPPDQKYSKGQQRLLDVIGWSEWNKQKLLQEAEVSDAVLTGLVRKGAAVKQKVVPKLHPPAYSAAAYTLNKEQRNAALELRSAINKNIHSSFLLDGVTGSGKTHVYFDVIEAALGAGKQVLWLVPEIALTTQLRHRFAQHFGNEPLVWHSVAGSEAKSKAWRIAAGDWPCVILGARSALHANFTNLGLVIVDEEHEQALKQTDMGTYHARDMAEHRAQLSNAVFVMGSATPSLESELRARKGDVKRLCLHERHGGALLVETELVDLRKSQPARGKWLSDKVVESVQNTLDKGQQAMLFLNRRGYAPLSLCSSCGHRVECHQCRAWMVEHRFLGELQCHLCGTPAPKPEICPSCGESDSLVACGPGIERLMEEAVQTFAEARIGVFSSDTLRSAAETRAAFDAVADGTFNLLIGTQVLAKGLDFPDLTLVAVIDGDLGLSNEDLRAGERTFQLIHQVTGRAGRGQLAGRALIQTRSPESSLMQALKEHDRSGFFDLELERRKAFLMPPYARLATLLVADENPDRLKQVVHDLARLAPQAEGADLWGPVAARLPLVRGWHRQRFVLRVPQGKRPQSFLRAWLSGYKFPSKTRVTIDIDPLSFT